MDEYISRSNVLNRAKKHMGGLFAVPLIIATIKEEPKADVVSREVFEQVKWERDTALQTLKEHGIGFGEIADAVEVVRCKDCKHYEIHKPSVTLNCEREGKLIPMEPTDFCSYGERKGSD